MIIANKQPAIRLPAYVLGSAIARPLNHRLFGCVSDRPQGLTLQGPPFQSIGHAFRAGIRGTTAAVCGAAAREDFSAEET
jgi:hypothetical protein